MVMVGVASGSPGHLTIGGHLAPFHIHYMNRVNSRRGSAMMTAP